MLNEFIGGELEFSVESAAQALAQAQDRPADDILRDDVAGTLLRLEELGLIESA